MIGAQPVDIVGRLHLVPRELRRSRFCGDGLGQGKQRLVGAGAAEQAVADLEVGMVRVTAVSVAVRIVAFLQSRDQQEYQPDRVKLPCICPGQQLRGD